MATKNFFQEVINGLSELKTLRVSTVIGSFQSGSSVTAEELQTADGQDAMITKMTLNDAMLSKVDMLTGDISTTMTENFVNNAQLREYHTLRENQGHEIVMRNVKVLKTVGQFIIDHINDSKNDSLNIEEQS